MPNIYESPHAAASDELSSARLGETNQIGIFDGAHPEARRFGALFNVSDPVSGYGGGSAEIVPPAPPP